MDRRLQLLLDQERFARVEAEAKRSGCSVAAVIRGAIDVAYPGDVDLRVESLGELVRIGKESVGERPEEDWAGIKEAIEADCEAVR